MKWSGRHYLQMFQNSSFFLGVGVLLAWGSFQAALQTGADGDTNFSVSQFTPKKRLVKPQASENRPAAIEVIDIFEKESNAWNFGELPMPSLKRILLEEKDLNLVFPAESKALKMKGADYSGECLSEILIDLLQPHGLGFYRQGRTIQVTNMTLKREKMQLEKNADTPLQSNLVRTVVRGRVGEPIDLWVDSKPLMRLRIAVQPFYGEAKNDLLGITVEGYRDQVQWFFHNLRTHMGQDSLIDVKAGGHMWCLLTPVRLDGKDITLKLEFHYETVLPSV